jgi:hypothetical protein
MQSSQRIFGTLGLLVVSLAAGSAVQALASEHAPLSGQTYAGNSAFLGEYQVEKVFTSDPHGLMSQSNDCQDPAKAGYRCNELVWAYQKGEALILFSKPVQEDIDLDSGLILYDIDCPKFYVPLSKAAQKGIFNVGACQVNLPSGVETTAAGNEPGISGGVALGDALTGTALRTSDSIDLNDDGSIEIHERMSASSIFTAFLMNVHADHDLVLTPVSGN